MAAPDFSLDTVELLGFRSCLICNNSQCLTVTVGPADGKGKLKNKIGEAAHIYAARAGQARFDKNMSDAKRADISNGIWLCASCHTMVDKADGADFPASLLLKWKSDHEALIKELLHSHRSPVPIMRMVTENGKIAQDVVDAMEAKGAMFNSMSMEIGSYVLPSITTLRQELNDLAKQVKHDAGLKRKIQDMAKQCQTYMNVTGAYANLDEAELMAVRSKAGVILRQLEAEYNCKIDGQLRQILPTKR